MKKLFTKLTSKSFIRYFIAGFSGFIVDTIVLNFLKFFILAVDTKVLGVIYLSKLIASIVGTIFSFFINRNWSFNAGKGKLKIQGIKMSLVFVGNIFVASLIYSFYFEMLLFLFGNNFLIALPTSANFLTEFTRMFINYFLYKDFVFKIKK